MLWVGIDTPHPKLQQEGEQASGRLSCDDKLAPDVEWTSECQVPPDSQLDHNAEGTLVTKTWCEL